MRKIIFIYGNIGEKNQFKILYLKFVEMMESLEFLLKAIRKIIKKLKMKDIINFFTIQQIKYMLLLFKKMILKIILINIKMEH